jgi:mitogen-activated protein kinase kinase kinase
MPSGTSPDTCWVTNVANTRRHWDEDKVASWLKEINCSQYVELFKRKCSAFKC